MNVRELIAKLSEHDPEAPAMVWDYQGHLIEATDPRLAERIDLERDNAALAGKAVVIE